MKPYMLENMSTGVKQLLMNKNKNITTDLLIRADVKLLGLVKCTNLSTIRVKRILVRTLTKAAPSCRPLLR